MIKQALSDFIVHINCDREVELYNEAGLQHEMALFLRKALGKDFTIRLEYPIGKVGIKEKLVKKEMDIYLSRKDKPSEQYCIELKLPYGRSIPRRMFQVHEDVFFLEQLKSKGFKKGFIFFTTPAKTFWREDLGPAKLYHAFTHRGLKIETLFNEDVPPFLRKTQSVDPIFQYRKSYKAVWQDFKLGHLNSKGNAEDWKCWLLEV